MKCLLSVLFILSWPWMHHPAAISVERALKTVTFINIYSSQLYEAAVSDNYVTKWNEKVKKGSLKVNLISIYEPVSIDVSRDAFSVQVKKNHCHG